jgi:hypothetical protein
MGKEQDGVSCAEALDDVHHPNRHIDSAFHFLLQQQVKIFQGFSANM